MSWLAAQIRARHAAGERYAQMAVLVRSAEHARAIAAALMAAGACASISPGSAPASPGRYSHSDTTLYISLVIIPTKYTGWRQNDVNVYA